MERPCRATRSPTRRSSMRCVAPATASPCSALPGPGNGRPIRTTRCAWAPSTCAPRMPRCPRSSPGSARRWPPALTFASVKLRAVPAERIRAALAALEPFDGYVINGPQFAGAFPDLFHDRPALYVAHNVEHRSAEENAAAARAGWPGCSTAARRGCCATSRRRLCGRAAFVYHAGRGGPRAARRRPARALRRAAAGHPHHAATASPAPRRASCDAALIGTWTWQPNRIGLDWFLDVRRPRLCRRTSASRSPASMPAGVKSDSPHGVLRRPRRRTPSPSCAAPPSCRSCSRAGTGVQLKTLETFELGLPAVATTRSLRGIDSLPGNCVVADEPSRIRRGAGPPGPQAARRRRRPQLLFQAARRARPRAGRRALAASAAGQRAAA